MSIHLYLESKKEQFDRFNAIPMSDLKPLEVAQIIGEDYKDHIVMRTASHGFEVIDLSCAGAGQCWTAPLIG
jgi:hypothetical protein